MKRTIFYAALAASAIAVVTAGAFAHSGATGVVKQRMDLMDNMADAMKALTAMMRGKESYDTERVRSLARQIAEHGGDAMTELFPEGSLEAPSETLPAVWTDWDRFSALADQLSAYAGALVAAAGNERMAPGGGGMMGGGMMGGGMAQGGMTQGGMAQGGMTQGGMAQGGMMMGSGQAGPSPEHLATMPPDAAFMHVSQTCSACHEDFRKEKNK